MKEVVHIGLAWAPHICSDIRRTLIFDPEDKFDVNDNDAIDEFEMIVQKAIDFDNRTSGLRKIDTITITCDSDKSFSELMTPGVLAIMRVCEYNDISLIVRVTQPSYLYEKFNKREVHFRLV